MDNWYYHRFVSDWNPERFISWATNIGDECKAYIINILDQKQHPEQSYKSCVGILHLAKKVGNTRLNNACKRAFSYEAYSYNIIVKTLEKGWDTVEDSPQEYDEVPTHKNIRGEDYYK